MDTAAVGDPVKFLEGPDGSLYYVDIGFNDAHVPNPASIRRIRYIVGNQPPTAVASANTTSGQAPLPVTFSSSGSVDPEEDRSPIPGRSATARPRPRRIRRTRIRLPASTQLVSQCPME